MVSGCDLLFSLDLQALMEGKKDEEQVVEKLPIVPHLEIRQDARTR